MPGSALSECLDQHCLNAWISTATPAALAPVRNPILGTLGGCCASIGAQNTERERRQTAAMSTRESTGLTAAPRRAVDTPMVPSASAMAQRVDRRRGACQAAPGIAPGGLTLPSLSAEAVDHVAEDARDVVVVTVVGEAAAEGDGAHGEDRSPARQLRVGHVRAHEPGRALASGRLQMIEEVLEHHDEARAMALG